MPNNIPLAVEKEFWDRDVCSARIIYIYTYLHVRIEDQDEEEEEEEEKHTIK